MGDQLKAHVLIVSFPVQGHINPALHFANRLLHAGADVTFATTSSGYGFVDKANVPNGIDLATFNDKSVSEVLYELQKESKPVTSLVYTLLLPWVAEVAREYHVPSALLWVQPAFLFDLYYYYFRGYGDVINECENDPLWCLQLPSLPFTVKKRDLPSILLPSTPSSHKFALPTFREQIEELEKEETPTILVNTFEALEVDALKAVKEVKLIPVGPLFPLTFQGSKVEEEDYMTWLDSKEDSSVIYVSFGSISVLSRRQQQELALALLLTHRPFLWVIRAKEKVDEDEDDDDKDELSCIMADLKHQGMILPWCSQVQVLSHPSIGCFVTHCGWNSTLESITCGVPMVAFPQWMDQTTNAKLIEDVWKIGVRVEKSEAEGLAKEAEISRCLKLVMLNPEMKENAKKWKELSVQASQDHGCSHKNIKDYIDTINITLITKTENEITSAVPPHNERNTKVV